MSVDFTLPDLGEGIHEAQIIQVSVAEGDTVTEDQALMEVETDKAAVEIPSPQAGIIEKVHVKAGQLVHVGDPLITFGGGADDKPSGEQKTAAPKAVPVTTAPTESAPPATVCPSQPALIPVPSAQIAAPSMATATVTRPTRSNGPVPASPAVRRRAREHNVDLHAIPATGPGGRVTQNDLEAFLGSGGTATMVAPPLAVTPVQPMAQPAVPAPAAPMVHDLPVPQGEPGTDSFGAVVRQPLTQIRKAIAAQMVRSYTQVPHVLHAEQVDVTELDEFRRAYKKSKQPGSDGLTLTPFIVKGIVNALKLHPKFNSSFDAEAGLIEFKRYFNIGMAVDTPRGLIVPVVRNVDTKNVLQLSAEYADVAERIRASRFTIDELRGGTFTITNVGALGGLFFTPIINYPEVAILGVGRARPTPVVREGEIVVRTMMPLCMSFDHRVCDGAEAARFMNDLIAQLENPIRMAL